MRAGGHPRWRAAGRAAKLLAGAVVLGVATILLVKREPDQHWSDPPIVTIAEDHDQATRSGDPPDPGRGVQAAGCPM